MLKKQIPIEDGLWKAGSSKEKAHLVGSKCSTCGELFFPKKKKGLCIHCQNKTLKDILLSRKGKIASFTVVERAPAGEFYKGPVPYAFGFVDLLENIRIKTLFAGNLKNLEVGTLVELVIDKLFDDEQGNEILTYKFKPLVN